MVTLTSYLDLYLSNHGTDAGFAAIARTGARRYIATHDEQLEYRGLVRWLQRRLDEKSFESSRQDCIGRLKEEEKEVTAQGGDEGRVAVLRNMIQRVKEVVCIRPEVGESVVL